MKLIPTRDAVGHVLCHDMTQIIPGQYKDARFRKGHVVREEDIPVLLSMGKENLYVWELVPGMVHEDEAAARLCALCRNEHMEQSAVKEGKLELTAAIDGLFRVDARRLREINLLGDIMIATRHGDTPVRRGDKLCGTRVIPLIIPEEVLQRTEAAAGQEPLLSLHPWKRKTAAIIVTGNEVKKGLIQDTFSPVVAEKLASERLRPEVVVVDPPRKGLGEEVVPVIASMEPERVVYVSCDPGTLARDVKRFRELGYEAVRAAAVDMFPRTRHVEAVVLLEPSPPGGSSPGQE